MTQTTKKKPKARPLKRLQSRVEEFKNVKWKRDTGNPLIDNAIEEDGFSFTIEFQGRKFKARSPDRKLRLMRKIDSFQRQMEEIDDEEDPKSLEILIEYEDTMEEAIEDMLEGFAFDDFDRISEEESEQLGDFCMEYWNFSKKKSKRLRNVST